MIKLIFSFSVCILFTQLGLAGEIGTAAIVRGEASLVHDKKSQIIKIGTVISEGDEVITQEKSYVKIIMADRNIVVVAEKSKLSINEYLTEKDKKNVQMTMAYGSARHVLAQKYTGKKEKYEVRTATTVAGVRGTDFLTIFNKDEESVICTLEGKVALGLLKDGKAGDTEVAVDAGHFVRVKKGDAQPQVVETDKLWLEKALKAHSLE